MKVTATTPVSLSHRVTIKTSPEHSAAEAPMTELIANNIVTVPS